MIQWKEELANLKDESLEHLANFWSKVVPGYSLNENGRRTLKKLMRQFSLDELMDAMQTAADQYLVFELDKPTQDSVEYAWGKVAGICRVERLSQSKPYMRELYYIRGILRKRVYVNESYIMELLETAVNLGADVEKMKSLAAKCKNWTQFRETVESFIGDAEKEQPQPGAG